MATSSVLTLTEPDQIEAAHAAARAEVVPTTRERLSWHVTRVELDNLWLVRVQESDFPCEPEARLFERARAVAASAIPSGYREVSAQSQRVADPGDPSRTIDTWCEVQLEKPVADLAGAVDEARRAVAFDKAASR